MNAIVVTGTKLALRVEYDEVSSKCSSMLAACYETGYADENSEQVYKEWGCDKLVRTIILRTEDVTNCSVNINS